MRTMKGKKAHRSRRGGMNRFARKLRSFDWATLLALVLFFPIGISRMWRARCKWPAALKYAVTGVFVTAAAVFVCTAILRVQPPRGGIELCGDETEVEIYGPELPETYVEGYTAVAADSGVLAASSEEEEDSTIYAYAAEDAKCYHTWKCRFAYASSKRITPYEAYFLGYKPCNICNPPVYNANAGQ